MRLYRSILPACFLLRGDSLERFKAVPVRFIGVLRVRGVRFMCIPFPSEAQAYVEEPFRCSLA